MTARPSPRTLAALLLPAALLAAAPQPPPPAPEPVDEDTYQGEAAERYAMVRVLEGSARIRKGDLEEDLTRGTPVGEGDVVESRGRGVLQLGEGTRVAFAEGTRFTVGALFTDQKGQRQVLLRLDQGRLKVQTGDAGDLQFKVDTPTGTVLCVGRGTFILEVEPDRAVRLKVQAGRVRFFNQRDQVAVAAGQRITVFSPMDNLDRVRAYNTYDGDPFDRWAERAMAVRRGESWDRLPSELRYYGDDLDANGRWVQTDEFGWVWQPRGVGEDWRPYTEGRWAPYPGGMTWVSPEPWAYVTYHHGRWHWAVGLGWTWIPGIYYSPAWVAWHHTPGYVGWAPLGYYNTPCHYGRGAWSGGFAWNIVVSSRINLVFTRTHFHTDVVVLRTFNTPGRDLHAPWTRSPLIVTRNEFHNPTSFPAVFHRDLGRERMKAYERHAQASTGRVVVRRELRPPTPGPAPRPGLPAPGPQRVPFEDRRRPGAEPGRPVLGPGQRPEGLAPRERPMESRPGAGPERRPEATPPRERPMEVRPAPAPERRPEATPPRERPMEVRPAPAPERRPEATPPRERPSEVRPAPAPERRPEATPPRERPTEVRPAPAPERRPEPQTFRERILERRPDPAPRERPTEVRPAPAPRERPAEPKPAQPEKPKEAPSKEKPKDERHR